jgi:hypothetical protein
LNTGSIFRLAVLLHFLDERHHISLQPKRHGSPDFLLAFDMKDGGPFSTAVAIIRPLRQLPSDIW